MGDAGKCSSSNKKSLFDLKQEFEDMLSKNDLTAEDLQAWANWYYENN